MTIRIEKGLIIENMYYSGTSFIDAKVKYEEIQSMQREKEAYPSYLITPDSEFDLRIIDVEIRSTPDFSSDTVLYEIKVRGELLE